MTIPSDDQGLRKKFDDEMLRATPEWWERFDWVHVMEERFGTRRWYIDPGVSTLYYNATGCFVFGLFPASLAMIGAATERWLRWVVGPERDLFTLIRKARTQDKISKVVEERLDRVRDLMRNPAAHGGDEVMMGVLGWNRITPHGWERPEGYEGLTGNLSAAKEALETFLLVVQETIQGGPGKAPC